MANEDIRNYAKEKRINLWEISDRLGYVYDTAFSRVLRHELPKEKKDKIRAIIDELAERENVKSPNILDYFNQMNEEQRQLLFASAEQILSKEREE